MPDRNSLPPWIVASLFLAAVTAVPLTCRLRSRSSTPSQVAELRTITALAEALSQGAPDLHVVPMARSGELESGIFICNQSHSSERLKRLPRLPQAIDRWHGVIFCTRSSLTRFENRDLLDEFEFQNWGDHGLRIEPFLFFGDPDLLRRVDKILRTPSRG